MARGEFIRRNGSEMTAVEVANGLVLPLEHLMTPIEKDDELYFHHLLGGGLIANSSYAPDDIAIPFHLTVGPDTQVVSKNNMSGLFHIQGNLSNAGEVSRAITEEGRKLRLEQREMGVAARLLEIERRLTSTAKLADTLF